MLKKKIKKRANILLNSTIQFSEFKALRLNKLILMGLDQTIMLEIFIIIILIILTNGQIPLGFFLHREKLCEKHTLQTSFGLEHQHMQNP